MGHLVVDVNVVLSSLLNRGNSSIAFTLNARKKKYRLIAPEFLLVELGKHTSEIAKRTRLSLEEAQKDLEFLTKQIKLFSEEKYGHKEDEARNILKEHQKDVPYLALALAFNCSIFSGDKVLKSIIPDRVKIPKELLEELEQER